MSGCIVLAPADTRRHEPQRVSAVLASARYAVLRDRLHTTRAFRDEHGREVDLHPVDPTDDGGGDQVLLDGFGPALRTARRRSIDGQAVRCSPPEGQMLTPLGY